MKLRIRMRLLKQRLFPVWWTVGEVHFRRGTRGWGCRLAIRVQTRRQFTMEDHVVEGFGPKNWRGFAGVAASFVAAMREARAVRKWLETLPGDFDLAA